jgi:hypothetical protein
MNFLGYQAAMLAFEANDVIGLRLMKIARGGVQQAGDLARQLLLETKKARETSI